MTPATRDDSDGGTPVAPPPIDKVDLLFVVDNTNSMAGEQASLKAALPRFIQSLTTGLRATGEPTGFPAITDLHVGVVSTDMGTPGIEISGCHADGGDDGRLLHTPRDPACATSYPLFLAYDANPNQSPAQFASDFACIAALGTGGCGFEQSLEAPLKAVTPSVASPLKFLANTPEGTLGRGDVPAAQGGNLGFLRNDAVTGRSLIAVVVISDEEDCSVRTTEHLKPLNQYPDDSPYKQQDINLRCFYNPQLAYDLRSRYLNGFRSLRQGDEQRVVFAAITGVPPDLVDAAATSGVDLGNTASRDAFYTRVLNDPRMQETIDPTTKPGQGNGNLTPSCSRKDATGATTTAYPPRRIVGLAQMFGAQGLVQSICQDDFSPATDAIVTLIGKQVAATRP